jgi:6-phosphogluconolactonase
VILVYPDKDALSKAAADRFVASGRAAIAERGRFTVALSGGHTPQQGFQLLATQPYVDQLDWSKVHIFWGDERNIPPSDANSNERMAREAFLNSVPIPAAQIHPMYIGGTAPEAAAAYETLLHTYFGPDGPTFDLVLLGLGPDGHTASLFPEANDLQDERWVIPAVTERWAVRDRITLSADAISLAYAVVFEVEGGDKAEILKEIIEQGKSYPTTYVVQHARDVTWLLDTAAAAQLKLVSE